MVRHTPRVHFVQDNVVLPVSSCNIFRNHVSWLSFTSIVFSPSPPPWFRVSRLACEATGNRHRFDHLRFRAQLYLPGRVTSPETMKYGLSKSLRVTRT